MALGEKPAALRPFLLSNSEPTAQQKRSAAFFVAVLAGAFLATLPFAGIDLKGTEALLPAYASAVLLVEVITAALLLTTYSMQRSRAVLVLSVAYLFSGLMVLPWVLTFPGVLDAFGLNTDMQSTATIAAIRRLSFAALLVLYAVLRRNDAPAAATRGPTVATSVVAVLAAAAVLSFLVLSNHGSLPRLMVSIREVSGSWKYVAMAAGGLYVAALVLLLRCRLTVLDLWLTIVVVTLLIEVTLLSFVSAGTRLSLGWWAGRLCGFVSAGTVLLMLLSQTTALYARLAEAVSQERRIRESRLTTMEALSGSIAHEINQPLSSMVTNANAALKWLEKPVPDVAEAQEALSAIVDDGHRAGKIVEGIRLIFQKSARDREALDMAVIARDAVRRWQSDAAPAGLSFAADLDDAALPVVGNRSQLEQVLSNLIANAVDATTEAGGRWIRLRCQCEDRNWLLVSVEDSGPGVVPETAGRIFDPFFTTKPGGMGMGLMFCRSVVEAHGGRLWLDRDHSNGAAFRFTLPRHGADR